MKKELTLSLGIYLYEDEESHRFIAYCPSLDLAGYAEDEDGAKNDFEYVLNDYLEYCMSEGTLEEDLKGHGWIVVKNTPHEPDVQALLSTNTPFRQLMQSNRAYRKMPILRTLCRRAHA